MNTENMQLMAACLKEFISEAGADWDAVYFWLSEPDSSYNSAQYSYLLNKELSMFTTEDDFNYVDVIKKMILNQSDEIEKEKGKRPLVTLLIVKNNGEFEFKFDYENEQNLNISKVGADSGKKISYFYGKDINYRLGGELKKAVWK